jgi:hypothetical protein
VTVANAKHTPHTHRRRQRQRLAQFDSERSNNRMHSIDIAIGFTQERVEESERTLVKREGVCAVRRESELVVVRPSEWCGVEREYK